MVYFWFLGPDLLIALCLKGAYAQPQNLDARGSLSTDLSSCMAVLNI